MTSISAHPTDRAFVADAIEPSSTVSTVPASIPRADMIERALTFYATEWTDVGDTPLGHALPAKVITHQLACDYGERARAALAAQALDRLDASMDEEQK